MTRINIDSTETITLAGCDLKPETLNELFPCLRRISASSSRAASPPTHPQRSTFLNSAGVGDECENRHRRITPDAAHDINFGVRPVLIPFLKFL